MMDNWTVSQDFPLLQQRHLYLWLANIDDFISSTSAKDRLNSLSITEQSRYHAYAHFQSKNRFLVGRIILREMLAHYLNCKPRSLQFSHHGNGKPYLLEASDSIDLRFNLSHSGPLLIIALALETEVGVDIEMESNHRNTQKIAQRFFHPSENQLLSNLPTHRQQAEFYRLWTRKEAIVKAEGTGIGFPLAAFEVDLSDDPVIRWMDESRYKGNAQLFNLPLKPPFYGSAAVLAENFTAHYLKWMHPQSSQSSQNTKNTFRRNRP